MMVSHIDADHITGVLELARVMKEHKDSGEPVPWRIKRFWHNSFDDTIALGGGASVAGAGASFGAADAFAADAEVFAASATLSPASVRQGRELGKLLPSLSLDGNKPFNGLVQYGKNANSVRNVTIGPLKLTVIGPNEDNIALLREDWAKKVVEVIKKDKSKAAAVVADYVDKSPYNLSSIVVLAECDGKKMLLTGDGRGDHTLDELGKAGLVAGGTIEVDLLKLPHHGSSRNVGPTYFETIRAKHYVISADGNHSNPDVDTLKMISAARTDDDFTIYLTYPYDEFHDLAVGKAIKTFFETEKAGGRTYGVVTRGSGMASISVDL